MRLRPIRGRHRKRLFYRLVRVIEFVCLFGVVPFLYFLKLFPIPVLGFLWIMTIVALIYLWRHPKGKIKELFTWNPPKEYLIFVFKRFAILAVLIALSVFVITPDRFFEFPLERFGVWILVMGFYPVFSVIPQSIIYRKFFELRYRPLFSKTVFFILGGAMAFSYMHIIYENWASIILTFVGGVFFTKTYVDTRSFLLSCLEHALYGCFMFTVGLGHFFYLGSG
jgi:hypothetical protein